MELIDLIDINGNKINKTIVRGHSDEINEGEYVPVVAIYLRSGIRYLIQYTSEAKGHYYATTGGVVPSGGEPLKQAVIEVEEELGLKLKESDLRYLGNIVRDDIIMYVYIYEDDSCEIEKYPFKLQDSEVEKILWLSKDEIEDLILKGMLRESTCEHYLKFIK